MENFKHYREIIGFDPDSDKSGVAVINVLSGEISVRTLPFPDIVEFLYEKAQERASMVVTEASWLRKKLNWHTGRTSSFVSYSVGRNHQTGILIGQMARFYGLDLVETEPLKKYWAGKDGKITHPELIGHLRNYGLTLMARQTNQETRDAVLIALSQWDFRNTRLKP